MAAFAGMMRIKTDVQTMDRKRLQLVRERAELRETKRVLEAEWGPQHSQPQPHGACGANHGVSARDGAGHYRPDGAGKRYRAGRARSFRAVQWR